MREHLGRLVAIAPLLAGCAGGTAAVAHSSDAPALGCSGWYLVSHDTLTANLSFTGRIQSVAVSAMLDDGSFRHTRTPLSVKPGTTARTVHLSDVTRSVTSVIVSVTGRGPQRSQCELTSPH